MDDCQSCGACCTGYEHIDVRPDDDHLPFLKEHDLVTWNTGLQSYEMKQTEGGRCVALIGEVGSKVSCSVYGHRPEGCEIYEAGSARCRNMIFIEITRKGKSLFTSDPDSWPGQKA